MSTKIDTIDALDGIREQMRELAVLSAMMEASDKGAMKCIENRANTDCTIVMGKVIRRNVDMINAFLDHLDLSLKSGTWANVTSEGVAGCGSVGGFLYS